MGVFLIDFAQIQPVQLADEDRGIWVQVDAPGLEKFAVYELEEDEEGEEDNVLVVVHISTAALIPRLLTLCGDPDALTAP